MAKMYRVPPAWAWWHAVAAQVERGVRPRQGKTEAWLNVLDPGLQHAKADSLDLGNANPSLQKGAIGAPPAPGTQELL